MSSKPPSYEPFGWHHWPDYSGCPTSSAAALGETQEGGGAVSEVLPGRGRMIPRRPRELASRVERIAERNDRRGDDELAAGARPHRDELLAARRRLLPPRRVLAGRPTTRAGSRPSTLESARKIPAPTSTRRAKSVDIPYEDGEPLCAYFVRAPVRHERQPVLISMGGLDSLKDEMWFMPAHGALQRGISVLLSTAPARAARCAATDSPPGSTTRCRSARASTGSSARATSTPRASRSAARASAATTRRAPAERALASPPHLARRDLGHPRALEGPAARTTASPATSSGSSARQTMAEAAEKAKPFKLEGVLEHMSALTSCIHGGHDVLGVDP